MNDDLNMVFVMVSIIENLSLHLSSTDVNYNMLSKINNKHDNAGALCTKCAQKNGLGNLFFESHKRRFYIYIVTDICIVTTATHTVGDVWRHKSSLGTLS